MTSLIDLEADRLEAGSFRDRTARVFYRDGAVCRRLHAPAQSAWDRVRHTRFFARFVADGRLIPTVEREPGVLQHEKVPCISYPYEWPFGMLQDAALLCLELLQAALAEDVILKDGTAYNVQWRGVRPVFIDIPSLVPLTSGQPWLGYRQFCQLFLFPLFLQAYRGVSFQPWLRGRLDGISAEECNGLLSWRDLLRPGVLRHVWLQALLQRQRPHASTQLRHNLQAAGFHKALIEANVRSLHQLIGGLRWHPASSRWSDYDQERTNRDTAVKQAFVSQAFGEQRRSLVWDLGCNTGRYTRLLADRADLVVALDADQLAVERLYRRCRAEGPTNVLPLVMDVADASPAQGWRLRERQPLLERGRPECVLCLALIHHLVLSANLPLDEVIAWLAGVTEHLIIEFPTPEDHMVRALLQARDEPAEDYNLAWFEQCLTRHFRITARRLLPSGTRILYSAETRR